MMETILALSPHTDDIEFGCGGLIAKYLELNKKIYVMVFSLCEQSIPRHLSLDTLEKELNSSMQILGVSNDNLICKNVPVRNFPEYRQQILDWMIETKNIIKPDMVLMPSLNDTHQDHNVISQEGFRAFKNSTILGYEIPWNNLTITTSSFCVLNKKHVEKKLEAMKEYKSQMHRSYANEEFIWGLARTRGVQCNHEYAEAFETYRHYC